MCSVVAPFELMDCYYQRRCLTGAFRCTRTPMQTCAVFQTQHFLKYERSLKDERAVQTSCEMDVVSQSFNGSDSRTAPTSVTWIISAPGSGPETMIDASCQRELDMWKAQWTERNTEKE